MNIAQASTAELYAFMRQSLADERIEDRSGRTQLQVLADELSTLTLDSPGLQNYFAAASQLIEEIPALSETEVGRLTALILSARKMAPAVLQGAQRLLNPRGFARISPTKRADVVRLLSHSGRRFLPREIEQIGIRDVRPWLWFDVVMQNDPRVAIHSLRELRDRDGFFGAILSRVNFIYKTLPAPLFAEFITAFSGVLEQADRQRLSQYLEGFEIESPRPGPHDDSRNFEEFAEEVIDRIPSGNTLELVPA